MKKKYLSLEFVIILIFLVIPPIFTPKIEEGAVIAGGGAFSIQILLQLLIAIFLHVQYVRFDESRSENGRKDGKIDRKKRIFSGLAWWAIALGLLMICEAAFMALSVVLKVQSVGVSSIPDGILPGMIFFLNLASGAFYEEAIYREFLPETLLSLIGKKKLEIPLELICVTLFALGHLYLGVMAVLNAFVCGIILRLCYKKSGGIWAGFCSHLIYNSIQALFLLLSS